MHKAPPLFVLAQSDSWKGKGSFKHSLVGGADFAGILQPNIPLFSGSRAVRFEHECTKGCTKCMPNEGLPWSCFQRVFAGNCHLKIEVAWAFLNMHVCWSQPLSHKLHTCLVFYNCSPCKTVSRQPNVFVSTNADFVQFHQCHHCEGFCCSIRPCSSKIDCCGCFCHPTVQCCTQHWHFLVFCLFAKHSLPPSLVIYSRSSTWTFNFVLSTDHCLLFDHNASSDFFMTRLPSFVWDACVVAFWRNKAPPWIEWLKQWETHSNTVVSFCRQQRALR